MAGLRAVFYGGRGAGNRAKPTEEERQGSSMASGPRSSESGESAARRAAAAAEVEVDEGVARAVEIAGRSRAPSTRRGYDRCISEFIGWCSDKRFTDGATVTGPKVNLFFQEEVLGRHRRKRRLRRRAGDVEEQSVTERVGPSTHAGYLNALSSLYREQVAKKINAHPHGPRQFQPLRDLLRAEQRHVAERNKDNFRQTGAGGIGQGISSVTGDTMRRFEVCDLHTYLLENEGPTGSHALIATSWKAKDNQYGQVYQHAFLRHKDALACPIGALGLYFYERFTVCPCPERLLNFSEEEFFSRKVFPGRRPTLAMSQTGHYKIFKRSLDELGIITDFVTHLCRKDGAKHAEMVGSTLDDIRKQAHWLFESMQRYCSNLPRELMRLVAGFGRTEGSYYCPRSTVHPPDALKDLVFPFLPEWRTFTIEQDKLPYVVHSSLKLFEWLAIVVLQDAAVLAPNFPGVALFHEEPFNSAEFASFAAKVRQAELAVTPVDRLSEWQRRELVGELVCDSLNAAVDAVKTSTATAISEIRAAVTSEIRSALEQVLPDAARQGVEKELRSGNYTLRIEPLRKTSPPPTRPSRDRHGMIQADAAQGQATERGPQLQIRSHPVFRAGTLRELARCWWDSVDGSPSAEKAEELTGGAWRTACIADRQIYSRRKKLANAVAGLANTNGISRVAAAGELDEQYAGRSLDFIAKKGEFPWMAPRQRRRKRGRDEQ